MRVDGVDRAQLGLDRSRARVGVVRRREARLRVDAEVRVLQAGRDGAAVSPNPMVPVRERIESQRKKDKKRDAAASRTMSKMPGVIQAP